MEKQQFNNHVRMHPAYHYVTVPIVVITFILSLVNLVLASAEQHYNAALIFIAYFALLMIGYMVRIYALKAQDRAIRAEESLRHFILTGKPLDSRLRMGQIIALRFASDEEFPALAARAAEEQLKGKEIKQAIKNWRPDYYRI